MIDGGMKREGEGEREMEKSKERDIYLMSQKGFGMVACSRVLGASLVYTQPLQTLSET